MGSVGVQRHDAGARHTNCFGLGNGCRGRWWSRVGTEFADIFSAFGTKVTLIEALCARLKVPNLYRELAVLAARHHTLVHRAAELKPATVLTLLEDCDAFRRPERFAELLLACEADARGRAGREGAPYPQADYLRTAQAAAAAVTLSEEDRRGLSGPRIGEEMRRRRLAAITDVKGATSAAPAPR